MLKATLSASEAGRKERPISIVLVKYDPSYLLSKRA